ncbi:hypothetical protein BGW80DRAFT_1276709 [Lactifluus volemus]|nr:hypothetical protein BGW80DRAFT_1276709 [Lactifluus volemus]
MPIAYRILQLVTFHFSVACVEISTCLSTPRASISPLALPCLTHTRPAPVPRIRISNACVSGVRLTEACCGGTMRCGKVGWESRTA